MVRNLIAMVSPQRSTKGSRSFCTRVIFCATGKNLSSLRVDCKNLRIAQEREEGIRQQEFAEGCSADFVLLIGELNGIERNKGRFESRQMSKDV